MTLKSIILAIFLILSFTIPAFCEYYQYVDDNGVKHFTDDIAQVPEHQKKGLNIHQTIDTPDEKKPAPKKNTITAESLVIKKDAITAESLVIKKDALDVEYDGLLKKREKLNEQKEQIGEKKYNKIAIKLNKEIKQYQNKSNAYEKLVVQYNDQITSGQNTPSAPWKKVQEQTE